MLAYRTALFGTSGTAKARAAAKAAAGAGREIVDLTAGEIWTDPPESLRTGAIAAIESGVNRYTESIGLERLRNAVAKRLVRETGQLWTADDVAITAGAKQALFNVALALLNPGDEVIIPVPYWTTFPAQVLLAGAQPVFVPARRHSLPPNIDAIRDALTPSTRAIIVNTPGNPTGAVLDRAMLASIAQMALEHDLWIIFDECYGRFVYEPCRHEHILTVMPDARPRTLVINSFSKSLAITGWRLGYFAGPREVISAVKAIQSHTTSNPSVIAQHAVHAFLQNDDGSFERDLRTRLTHSRACGLEILSRLREVPQPTAQGGFYFYLDLSGLLARQPRRGTIKDADDVTRVLLEDSGVAVVSGSAFGDPASLRLSYGVPPDALDAGLEHVVETLNALT